MPAYVDLNANNNAHAGANAQCNVDATANVSIAKKSAAVMQVPASM